MENAVFALNFGGQVSDFPEVMSYDQVQAYLQVGRDKVADWMNRPPDDNPLPHVRTSDTNSKHSPALFKRSHVDAWLDREVIRQMGITPLGTMRRAG